MILPQPESPIKIVRPDCRHERSVNPEVLPVPAPHPLLQSAVASDADPFALGRFREPVPSDPHEHAPVVIVAEVFVFALASVGPWDPAPTMQERRRVFPFDGDACAPLPVALELVPPHPAADTPALRAGQAGSPVPRLVQVPTKEPFPNKLMISHNVNWVLVETGPVLGWLVEQFASCDTGLPLDLVHQLPEGPAAFMWLPPPCFRVNIIIREQKSNYQESYIFNYIHLSLMIGISAAVGGIRIGWRRGCL